MQHEKMSRVFSRPLFFTHHYEIAFLLPPNVRTTVALAAAAVDDWPS
jgi:hypothetical protein